LGSFRNYTQLIAPIPFLSKNWPILQDSEAGVEKKRQRVGMPCGPQRI
jgi:hypothetical protein